MNGPADETLQFCGGSYGVAPPDPIGLLDPGQLLVVSGLEFRPVDSDSAMTHFVTFETEHDRLHQPHP